jgi:hypothetical protein
MRLHFLIFSALAGVPFVGLPYATKVSGFLEELRLQAPALEHVSAGQLIAHTEPGTSETSCELAYTKRSLCYSNVPASTTTLPCVCCRDWKGGIGGTMSARWRHRSVH